MTRSAFCLAVAVAVSPAVASAATSTLFSDDFAAEVVGKPATGFQLTNFAPLAQWDIVDGAVDMFTNGGFGLPCGSAGCLDLDGTVGNAARLESKTTFSFLAGANYTMSLTISGKNGNGNESLTFGVIGGETKTLSMPAGDNAARTVDLDFLQIGSTSGKLFIDHSGGDNFGILLDAVSLTETTAMNAIPLPATLPLAIGGLAALGAIGARRRA